MTIGEGIYKSVELIVEFVAVILVVGFFAGAFDKQ